MPLFGQLAGAIVSRGQSGANPAAGAPLNPPTILTFTLDDMTLDTGVPGTFSWTKSGTQTGAVLDPGDGSGNYTLTTESSQAHTYDAEGVYDATLVLTGPGGTSIPASVNDIAVTVTPVPGITVTGNGVSITDGDATPSAGDHTQFTAVVEGGATSSRTYTVTNTGTANLITSGMTVPTGFTITEPLSGTIAPGASDTFTVRLDGVSVGVATGNISFTTNVSGKNPFNFAIEGEVTAASVQTFVQVTKFSSPSTSGVVTPVGVPFPYGTAPDGDSKNVSQTQVGKMVIRYPNSTGGTLYTVQTEQIKYREDGKALHCTAHIPLPPGYVANTEIGVGWSDTHTRESAPDWVTLDAVGDDLVVNVSIYEPRVTWVEFSGNGPVFGDTTEIVLSDGTTTRTYTHTQNFATAEFGSGNFRFINMMKQIQLDTAGLWQCIGKEAIKLPRISANPNMPVQFFASPNDGVHNQLGVSTAGPNFAYRPILNGGTLWGGGQAHGIYIWSRWVSGNPVAFTTTAAVTKSTIINFDGMTTGFGGTHSLPFDNQTSNFSPGDYIYGLTSGASARVSKQVDSGTSGTLYIYDANNGPNGQFFLDNEGIGIKSGYDGFGVSSQMALVNGSATRLTLTSSAGGTAEIWAYVAYTGTTGKFAVRNISGSFTDNSTLTDGTGGSALQNGAGSITSTTQIYTDATTLANSGTITPLVSPSNRVTWTASFNTATATAVSPWFDGTHLRQQERTMKLKNGGSDHPHIVARFYVSRWRDGTIKDRQVVLESTEIANAIRDYWIDADFLVGGVSQAVWTDKYLTAHTSARWTQTKPFGMCTAGDFMRAHLILPWGRTPSADNNAKAAAKLRGGVANRTWYWTDTSQTADLGGYVNANVNEPFWPIPWNWSRTGGARPELGLNNSYESLFWKGNTVTNWPMALAMADNGISAHPFQHRDESPPANVYPYMDPASHADGPPNLYTRWNYRTAVYTTGKPRGAGPTVITQPYQLGRYMENLASTASHHPSPGIYNAYIIQPEKRYFDLQEMFTWYFQEHPESGAGATGNPDVQAVGGPNHHLAYEPANGNRSFAWPWREIARMAFMCWSGHPRRDYWRRVNQDMCDHYNASAEKTYWGAFHTRGYPLSTADETNPHPRTLEANWRDGLLNMNAGAPEYPTSLNADDGLSFFKQYDGFKGAFVNFVALQCKDLNSGDISSGLAKNVWQVRVLKTNPDQTRWFMLAGSGWYICRDLVWNGSAFVSATHPNGYRPWPDESGADLWAWISANESNLTGFAGLKTTTAAVLADLDYTPGYSFVKGTQVGLLLQARHGAGVDKTDAQYYFNLINSTWPRTTTRGSYEFVNYTYADWFMQLDVIADADIVD